MTKVFCALFWSDLEYEELEVWHLKYRLEAAGFSWCRSPGSAKNIAHRKMWIPMPRRRTDV